jgi:hypothetical protein
MRRFALGLASAGAFTAITIGLAGPAMASPDYVVPGQDEVYSTNPHSTTHRPANCAIQINYTGPRADVKRC